MHRLNTGQGQAKSRFVDDDKELCAEVCLSIASGLKECVNNEGWQFEHF